METTPSSQDVRFNTALEEYDYRMQQERARIQDLRSATEHVLGMFDTGTEEGRTQAAAHAKRLQQHTAWFENHIHEEAPATSHKIMHRMKRMKNRLAAVLERTPLQNHRDVSQDVLRAKTAVIDASSAMLHGTPEQEFMPMMHQRVMHAMHDDTIDVRERAIPFSDAKSLFTQEEIIDAKSPQEHIEELERALLFALQEVLRHKESIAPAVRPRQYDVPRGLEDVIDAVVLHVEMYAHPTEKTLTEHTHHATLGLVG